MKQPKNLKSLTDNVEVYGYQSPIGKICFEVKQSKLISMYFSNSDIHTTNHFVKDKTADIILTYLEDYFSHKACHIDPNLLEIKATPFQQSVYKALLNIKYGETKSYQDIASELKNKNLVRAVGQACKKNPIGIIIPCHRVIHKDGRLGGYSGIDAYGYKAKLLEHEKII
jgi:O-6-methylguanine DNA methyltransferase